MRSMTIREKMLAVYRNEVPDKIPVAVYDRFLQRGSVERELRNLGLGIIQYYPVISFLGPPWHLYSGFISEIKGAEIDLKYYWENGRMVERRYFKTPIGEIYQDISVSIGVGSEAISKYYIKSPNDYRIMKYLVENTVFKRNENTLKMKIKNLGDDGIVLGRIDRSPYQKLLIEWAGAEQFLIDLYTDNEPVLELMNAMDRKMDEAILLIAESDVEVIWQPENITSDMTPPECYKKYCLPFYKKHIKKIKESGKQYYVHMDGKIKALTELINETEIDGIESFSLPIIGGDLTFAEAKNAFPDKVIIPNFPSNISHKSDIEIVQFLEELLQEVGSNVPFMLQISEDIPENELCRILFNICNYLNNI